MNYACPVVDVLRLEAVTGGTRGVMRIGGRIFGCTMEPPGRLNALDVSSIPAGQYRCRRFESAKFGLTFEVRDVPGRKLILIHWGNTAADTEGCIIVGSRFGELSGRPAVLESRKAFDAFMTVMSGIDEFMLMIREFY